MFVANVGDSTAVLGIKNLNSDGQLQQPMFVAKKITKDHKPIDPIEQTRLHQLGKTFLTSIFGTYGCYIVSCTCRR